MLKKSALVGKVTKVTPAKKILSVEDAVWKAVWIVQMTDPVSLRLEQLRYERLLRRTYKSAPLFRRSDPK